MIKILKRIGSPLVQYVRKKRKLNLFYKELDQFKQLDTGKRLSVSKDLYPCLDDRTSITYFEAHYTYHPAWAARVIKEIMPEKHIDISSALTFCTMLSAFVETEFYDYRPALLSLDNLTSAEADLTSLHFADNSIESLSCMHTIEHIGLGRYGDRLDPEGDMKAIQELARVCAPGGNLLVVVPVGEQKIVFNAHRIYRAASFAEYFEGFTLKEFSLVDDKDGFMRGADLSLADKQLYGCGCFWFIKDKK
jgi:SAM-dependent methyltransferase